MSGEGNVQVKDEILSILDKNKEFFGAVRVQSAIVREKGLYRNIVTKIVPLYKNKKHTPVETLDYGDFVLVEDIISVENLKKELEELISKEEFRIKAYTLQKDDTIQFEKVSLLESGDELFNLGWSAHWYMVRINESSITHIPTKPLLALKNPLFPHAYHAIKSRMGLDLLNHKRLQDRIIILLPNYRARIEQVEIKSEQLAITIETQENALKDFLGKVWCEGKEGKETQEDITFDQQQKILSLEYTPKDVYVCLLSTSTGEVIDYWERRSRSFPKEMNVDMTIEEICELIKKGENQKVEFKEKGVGNDKLAKELVAFANTNDGIIFMGVDDEGNIKGLPDTKKLEEQIMDIAEKNCNPSITPETKEYTVEDKKILAIFVPIGRHTPYQRNDGKVFVRRGSTSRNPDHEELIELSTPMN